MGNSVLDSRLSSSLRAATITKFYTSDAWVDGRAEDQLHHVAKMAGVQHIAAFPDLHLGKYGPVGCAGLADRIYPQLIGNDIGCGMSLFQLDLQPRKIKLEKAVRRLRELGETSTIDYRDRLTEAGLAPNLLPEALGTIGAGNHFCELQTLKCADRNIGLDLGQIYLLVHSGSRSLGTYILNDLPEDAFMGMKAGSSSAQEYVTQHDQAVIWAKLNRQIIAERAASALRADLSLIVDVPHNQLAFTNLGWVHRKGAACADGDLVPLAGTRATPSYLMQTSKNVAGNLQSTAHGAGRKFDRSSMHGRVRAKKSDIKEMQRTSFGGRVICEDKAALVEEAPKAYKSVQTVASDLEALGLSKRVATFHPLVTFKKIRGGR